MSKFVLSGDFNAYKSGDNVVFNNVWGKGSLVNGVDYYQNIIFDTDSVTTGVTFSWSWPARASGEIYAYPEIVWGDSPFYDGADESHTNISKVSDLRAFAVDLDLDVAQGSKYCNLSFDVFLTKTPFGNADTISTEVMIWVDTQATRLWGTKVVGTFTDGSHTATIYFADGGNNADYIAVVFDKPWLSGSIDIKEVLKDLGQKGLISTDDYVSGHQFGAELSGGQGSFTISHLTTTFKTNHAPTLESAIADQAVSQHHSFEFQVEGFVDVDTSDTLTYSATLANGDSLPSWLTFDTTAGTFTGTPGSETFGIISVKVTASDGMASLSDIFNIDVLAAEDEQEEPTANPEGIVLRGTAKDDTLVGDGGDDVLQGLRGRDILDGSDGVDTTSYRNASSAVVVNLARPVEGRGDAKGDRFFSIENLQGTRFGDRLAGDDSDNQLDGGKGNDVLTGGEGSDVFIFGAKYGKDVIRDFDVLGSEHDLIDLSDARGVDSFEDLMQNHIKDIGHNLVITTSDGSRLTINGIYSVNDLTSENFIF